MDERILVEVYVPIVQLHFDTYLPMEVTLMQCVNGWKEFIKKKQRFQQENICLYHESDNKVLSLDLYVKDSGLHTGSSIILL